MDAVILLIVLAGSIPDTEEAKTCVSIVQAIEWSRWVGQYDQAKTIASFEEWANKADKGTSSLRLDWYEPTVRALITSGFAAQDRETWRDEAMRDCLSLAGDKT